MNRSKTLERVRDRTEPWDIIVIGGGATGVGCAVDAASRGYDVLLLEQHDFGKGTSSRSTKLIHGGIRYLRQGNLSLVREALKERGILLRNAPHVVHTQEFIVPCYGIWEHIVYWVGLKAYDFLAGKYSIGKSRSLSRAETIDRLPTVKTEGLSGGVLYRDGQFDDTRLLIDLARIAHENGGAMLNYARVSSFTRGHDGAICGVEFTDAETGETFLAPARSVINATGIFSDRVRQMSDQNVQPSVTFAQGTHLVFDRKFLRSDAAIMIPKTSDGRVLFCLPWYEYLLVGTTDTPVPSAELEPSALGSEIDFILETAGEYLAVKPTRDDILSVFAGIRPLVGNKNIKNTSAISRSYDLVVDDSGLITITGGKWTTYRRMAEDAVDKAIVIGDLDTRACVTEEMKITGSSCFDGARIHPDLFYTRSDIERAIRDEMARTVEDVLARRTRALFLNAAAAIEIAPIVAEIMAAELGKDQEWRAAELERFMATAKTYLPALKDEL